MKPMKASPVAVVPEGPDWICEVKYDGWRGSIRKHEGVTGVFSATSKPIHTVPYITDALANLPDNTVLDGELVNLDGTAQWNKAQKIASRTKPVGWVHVPTPDDVGLTFVVFDLLELMGRNLHRVELHERRELLETLFKLVPDSPYVEVIDRHPCTQEALELLVLEGYEGVVCKRLDSFYSPGARNGDWVKIKPETEIEVMIAGFYDPEPGSKYDGNAVGGFTFTVTHPDGKTYSGRCGTGMDNELREAMREDQARIRTGGQSEFVGRVAELKHWGIGDTGALRFPSLKRIRNPADKEVPEVVRELETATNMPSGAPSVLLERALDAEERANEAEARIAELEAKLGGAVAASLKGKRAGTGSGPKTRNYNAMDQAKLDRSIEELEAGAGEAYEKALATEANGGWSIEEHLRKAHAVRRAR